MHAHPQNSTNAILLAIANKDLGKVVDALLDCKPELDLQDQVCKFLHCTLCLGLYFHVVWRNCTHNCLQDEELESG